jgi:PP-loop superfamily ATP-utilizing enzyme
MLWLKKEKNMILSELFPMGDKIATTILPEIEETERFDHPNSVS